MAIINVDVDPNFYDGEIPKADLLEILRMHQKLHSIELAVHEIYTHRKDEYYRRLILDPRRALGIKLLGTLNGKRVLEYGCQLGTIGFVASKLGAEVTFVDNCCLNLTFTERRCLEGGITNATFIACRDLCSFPELERKFDITIINCSSIVSSQNIDSQEKSRSSKMVQTTDQLKYITRLLNPDGIIYTVLDCRSPARFIGNASSISRRKKQHSPGPKLLSRIEEKFQELGIEIKEKYTVFPGNKFPELIVCLDDIEGVKKEFISQKDPVIHPQEDSVIHRFNQLVNCLIRATKVHLLESSSIKDSTTSYILLSRPSNCQ